MLKITLKLNQLGDHRYNKERDMTNTLINFVHIHIINWYKSTYTGQKEKKKNKYQ